MGVHSLNGAIDQHSCIHGHVRDVFLIDEPTRRWNARLDSIDLIAVGG